MKKRRLVLASILKPVNDTRMYEKIGRSLVNQTDYEIHVIGYPSAQPETDSFIHFHPLPSFKRISWKRLLAPLQVLLLVRQVKPEVMIITTHELLIVSFVNRILFGVKIIYDIQENYYRNILYSEGFPGIIRPIVATWVRAKERLFAPFIHWFFLAEKGYEKELNFPGQRFTVLENKCQYSRPKKLNTSGKTRLIFSGTLSEVTGVFRAIRLAKLLHERVDKIELRIVGYTPLPSIYERIQKEIAGFDFITLRGGLELVPHVEILHEIASSDFGLIAYQVIPSIENSMPTKLFEYLHHQLPILLQEHPPWEERCLPYPAAIVLDYDHPNVESILNQMRAIKFYTTRPRDVSWASEEKLLISVMRSVF